MIVFDGVTNGGIFVDFLFIFECFSLKTEFFWMNILSIKF